MAAMGRWPLVGAGGLAAVVGRRRSGDRPGRARPRLGSVRRLNRPGARMVAAGAVVLAAIVCLTQRSSLGIARLALAGVAAGAALRRLLPVADPAPGPRAGAPGRHPGGSAADLRDHRCGRVPLIRRAPQCVLRARGHPVSARLHPRSDKSTARRRRTARRGARLAVRGRADRLPGRLVSPRPDRLRHVRLSRRGPHRPVLRRRLLRAEDLWGQPVNGLLAAASCCRHGRTDLQPSLSSRRTTRGGAAPVRAADECGGRGGARSAGRAERPPQAFALTALAVSAIWALEAFVYTALTFAAIVLAHGWLQPVGTRRAWMLRRALFGVSRACSRT